MADLLAPYSGILNDQQAQPSQADALKNMIAMQMQAERIQAAQQKSLEDQVDLKSKALKLQQSQTDVLAKDFLISDFHNRAIKEIADAEASLGKPLSDKQARSAYNAKLAELQTTFKDDITAKAMIEKQQFSTKIGEYLQGRPKEKTTRQLFTDPLGSFVAGIPDLVSGVAGVANLVAGDSVTRNIADGASKFSDALRSALVSDQGVKEGQALSKAVSSGNVGDAIGEIVKNPSLIPNTIAGVLPSMFGGMGLTRVGLSAIGKAAPATTLLGKAGQGLAYGAGEGVIAGGQSSNDARQAGEAAGLTPDQILAAQRDAAGTTAAITTALGPLSLGAERAVSRIPGLGRLAGDTLDKAPAQGFGRTLLNSATSSVKEGSQEFVSEGFTADQSKSAVEAQRTGESRNRFDQFNPAAAGVGFISGATLGAFGGSKGGKKGNDTVGADGAPVVAPIDKVKSVMNPQIDQMVLDRVQNDPAFQNAIAASTLDTVSVTKSPLAQYKASLVNDIMQSDTVQNQIASAPLSDTLAAKKQISDAIEQKVSASLAEVILVDKADNNAAVAPFFAEGVKKGTKFTVAGKAFEAPVGIEKGLFISSFQKAIQDDFGNGAKFDDVIKSKVALDTYIGRAAQMSIQEMNAASSNTITNPVDVASTSKDSFLAGFTTAYDNNVAPAGDSPDKYISDRATELKALNASAAKSALSEKDSGRREALVEFLAPRMQKGGQVDAQTLASMVNAMNASYTKNQTIPIDAIENIANMVEQNEEARQAKMEQEERDAQPALDALNKAKEDAAKVKEEVAKAKQATADAAAEQDAAKKQALVDKAKEAQKAALDKLNESIAKQDAATKAKTDELAGAYKVSEIPVGNAKPVLLDFYKSARAIIAKDDVGMDIAAAEIKGQALSNIDALINDATPKKPVVAKEAGGAKPPKPQAAAITPAEAKAELARRAALEKTNSNESQQAANSGVASGGDAAVVANADAGVNDQGTVPDGQPQPVEPAGGATDAATSTPTVVGDTNTDTVAANDIYSDGLLGNFALLETSYTKLGADSFAAAKAIVGIDPKVSIELKPLGIDVALARYVRGGAIEINTSLAEPTPQVLTQVLVEEVLHAIDVGSGVSLAHQSGKYSRQSEVFKELASHYANDGVFANYLRYVLDGKKSWTEETFSAEVFANLGVAYLSDPQLLKQELPKSYEQLQSTFLGANGKSLDVSQRRLVGRSAQTTSPNGGAQRLSGEGGSATGADQLEQARQSIYAGKPLPASTGGNELVGGTFEANPFQINSVNSAISAATNLSSRMQAAAGDVPAIKGNLSSIAKAINTRGASAIAKFQDLRSLSFLYAKEFTKDGKNLLAKVVDLKTEMGAKAKNNIANLDKKFVKGIYKGVDFSQGLANVMMGAKELAFDPSTQSPSNREQVALKAAYDSLNDKEKVAYTETLKENRSQWQRIVQALKTTIQQSGLEADAINSLLSKVNESGQSVYFAHMRFGRWTTHVRGVDGKTIYFGRHESRAEAEVVQAQLKRDFPDSDVQPVSLYGNDNKQRFGDSSETYINTVVNKAKARGQENADVLEQIMREVLMKAQTDRLNANQRKFNNIAGASTDMLRASVSSMMNAEFKIAHLEDSPAIDKAMTEMRNYVESLRDNGNNNVATTKAVYETVRAGVYYSPNESDAVQKVTSALTAFGFINTMGANISTAVLNTTGLISMGIPELSARYGVGAPLAVMKAIKDVTANFRGGNDSAELKKVRDFAIKTGLMDYADVKDLMDVAESSTGTGRALGNAMWFMSWPMQQTEKFTNLSIMLAAYRMAKENGQTDEAALEVARDVRYRTNFDNSSDNKSLYGKMPVGRVALQLKSYGIAMSTALYRDAKTIIDSAATKEEKSLAAKRLGGVILVHGILSGAAGMPWVFALPMALAGLAVGALSDDEEEDTIPMKERVRSYLIEAIGEDATRLVTSGVLGEGMSQRVSLSDLLASTRFEAKTNDKNVVSFMFGLAGPAATGIQNLLVGGLNVADGTIGAMDGFKKAAPAALANAAKGAEILMGDRKLQGNDGISLLANELSNVDALAQAMGFRPADKAYAQERKKVAESILNDQQAEKRSVMNLYKVMMLDSINGNDIGAGDELYAAAKDQYNLRWKESAIDEKEESAALKLLQENAQITLIKLKPEQKNILENRIKLFQ